MGIPTGPQQGQGPSRGGIPTGRPPGNQQPAQPRQRPAGIPQPQNPAQPANRPASTSNPATPQRRPAQQPQQRPVQQPQRQAPPAQRPPRRAPEPESALPQAPDETFEDPFAFNGQDDDPFSDVPQGYGEQDSYGSDQFIEDDPFSPVDAAQSDEYSEDEDTYVPEPEPRRTAAKASPAATPRRLQGTSRAPERGRAADEEYEEEFVDKKNLKLKPFGKPKKKARAGDFDPRKNMEGQRKLYRGIFVAAVVAIVGFGAYQTFWPQESLSYAEVEEIASVAVGDTGFPTTRGEGFALNFVDSLMNIQPGQESLAKRTAALSYFYGGTGDSKAADAAVATVGNISQSVVYGPVVLDSAPITANAAAYEIGVLLSTSDADAPAAEGSVGDAEIAESLRWVSFNVNVYYDEAKNSFAVAPNSPSLLPAPSVAAPSVVPAGEPLGEAVDNAPESIDATVLGFIDGYRQSSKTDFSKILQYIGSNADETLRDGLASRYQFATPEDPSSSIKMDVYSPGGSSDLSELKIDLTVDWQIATGENSSVTFPSHYVLTLQSSGGSGDYTVTKFAPYYWIEASDAEAK